MSSAVRRSVLVYAGAFAVAGATPFLLLPVLTQRLSPQQFGEVTSFLVFTALLGNITGLSAHGFIGVRFFKLAGAPFARLVTSSLAAVAVVHVLAALFIAVASPWLGPAFGLSTGSLLLAVPAALFVCCNLVWLAILQSAGQPMRYFAMRLAQALVEIGLCLALLGFVAADAHARIHSYVVAIAVSAALGALWCMRQGHAGRHASVQDVRTLLAFGLPLLPHVVAGSAIVYLDRLVVSSLLGADGLGLYMVAMQLGMVMVALVEPLNKALAPWLLQRLAASDASARQQIVRRTYQLQAALVLLGLVVAVAAMLLFEHLIGAPFARARMLVPWMVAGYALQGMYYTVVIYLFFAEKTGRLSVISCSVAAVGLVVSILATRQWGLAGAGASFVVNNALLLALVWAAAAHAVPMPWWRGRTGTPA